MSLPKAIKGEKAKMVKTELKSLKDTLLSKYADIENVNGIKQILLGEASGMAKTVSWVRLLSNGVSIHGQRFI